MARWFPVPGLLALLLLLAPSVWAQPDLSRQDSWGDKEKKEFLQYLRSGQPAAPRGQVKTTRIATDEGATRPPRKPFFASVAMTAESLMTVAGNGSILKEGASLGPKVLVGGHVFTWLRYYTGVMGTRLRQQKLDGTRPLVSHLQLPAGVEFALVPLGTPHTRYLLLRGGAALHYFGSPSPAGDFRAPLVGWQATWNLGLGYEWQIPDTRWRVHGLVEGAKDMIRQGSTAQFYGLAVTLGVVHTF